MGFPEQEITVTGSVKEESDGGVVVDTEAEQAGNRIIRNAEAELKTGRVPGTARGAALRGTA